MNKSEPVHEAGYVIPCAGNFMEEKSCVFNKASHVIFCSEGGDKTLISILFKEINVIYNHRYG
jgi:hypothetical protein